MSVIAELTVGAESFDLGRVLAVPERADVELEEVVPIGDEVVPLFWLHETDASGFVEEVEENDLVQRLQVFEETSDRTLYALQWDASQDRLLGMVRDLGGYLLAGTGRGTEWTLQVRFPSHDALSTFRERCEEQNVRYEVESLYNPTRPDAGRWYGLSEVQRETILLAYERGYYDIPRQASTKELADELGVSDQAVTERLRRAITTLLDNTLYAPGAPEIGTAD